MKIKSKRQFKDGVDAAFETQKTRDEAKACYDFARDEYRAAEEELGLVRVTTMSMKLKAKSSQAA